MRINYKYVNFPDDLHKRDNTMHSVHVESQYNMTTDTYEVTVTWMAQVS